MAKEGYAGWALSTIALISQDNRIHAETRCQEILCVTRHDGHYPESFEDGDTPAEAWESEVDSIKDSQ